LADPVLIQAWINTSYELKNSGYKHWNYAYLMEHDYPFKENFSNGLADDVSKIETFSEKLKIAKEYG
jgi:hypothetical protein